jgi:hypothetical protein
MNIHFGCLDGIILVVDGGGRTSQIEYLIYLGIKRKGDVVANNLEIRVL